MPQTAVNYTRPRAFEGMCADSATKTIRGAIQELTNGSTSPLPFGRAVVSGSSAQKIVLPSAAGQSFRGITILNQGWGQEELGIIAGNTPGTPVNYPAEILTLGDIWVWAELAVAVGDDVYFRHTAEAAPNDQIGRFTNVAGANQDQVPNAKFLTSTSGAGLAVVNLGGF